jgi:hypothetical protein
MLMGADREPERREEAANIADQALASFIVIQAGPRSRGCCVVAVCLALWALEMSADECLIACCCQPSPG